MGKIGFNLIGVKHEEHFLGFKVPQLENEERFGANGPQDTFRGKGMKMSVGYARVSTPEQKYALQLDALEYVRPADNLVPLWRLDRLGRSLMHLIEVVNSLHERKVGFKSLVDTIDTTTPTGKFFFHITGAFAELERNLIRERTRAGLKAARARGRSGGRPKAIDPKTFQMALEI